MTFRQKLDVSVIVDGMELGKVIDWNRKCCMVRVEAVAFAYLVKKFDSLKDFTIGSEVTSNFEADMALNK